VPYKAALPAWRTGFFLVLPILLLVSSVAVADKTTVLERYSLDAQSMLQWRLPDRLNEISGLAVTPDGRLLAVDDEVAIIYELDYDDGHLVKAFALGNPVVKGDFEGIAVADDLIYLTTSSGRVYVSAEGADGQRVTFSTFDTDLGDDCDIEGLVQNAENTRLYFLCKKVRKKSRIAGLTLFAWDIAGRQVRPDESVVLPAKQIMQHLRIDRINPSGITIDRHTGNRIIVASRQQALVELAPDGKFVDARSFPLAVRHRQAEGIELAIDGRLLIADEGGTHKARLAVYRQDRTSDLEND
jgi:uncharacterized protein YjiK